MFNLPTAPNTPIGLFPEIAVQNGTPSTLVQQVVDVPASNHGSPRDTTATEVTVEGNGHEDNPVSTVVSTTIDAPSTPELVTHVPATPTPATPAINVPDNSTHSVDIIAMVNDILTSGFIEHTEAHSSPFPPSINITPLPINTTAPTPLQTQGEYGISEHPLSPIPVVPTVSRDSATEDFDESDSHDEDWNRIQPFDFPRVDMASILNGSSSGELSETPVVEVLRRRVRWSDEMESGKQSGGHLGHGSLMTMEVETLDESSSIAGNQGMTMMDEVETTTSQNPIDSVMGVVTAQATMSDASTGTSDTSSTVDAPQSQPQTSLSVDDALDFPSFPTIPPPPELKNPAVLDLLSLVIAQISLTQSLSDMRDFHKTLSLVNKTFRHAVRKSWSHLLTLEFPDTETSTLLSQVDESAYLAGAWLKRINQRETIIDKIRSSWIERLFKTLGMKVNQR
jgi:hypothetical protein